MSLIVLVLVLAYIGISNLVSDIKYEKHEEARRTIECGRKQFHASLDAPPELQTRVSSLVSDATNVGLICEELKDNFVEIYGDRYVDKVKDVLYTHDKELTDLIEVLLLSRHGKIKPAYIDYGFCLSCNMDKNCIQIRYLKCLEENLIAENVQGWAYVYLYLIPHYLPPDTYCYGTCGATVNFRFNISNVTFKEQHYLERCRLW